MSSIEPTLEAARERAHGELDQASGFVVFSYIEDQGVALVAAVPEGGWKPFEFARALADQAAAVLAAAIDAPEARIELDQRIRIRKPR